MIMMSVLVSNVKNVDSDIECSFDIEVFDMIECYVRYRRSDTRYRRRATAKDPDAITMSYDRYMSGICQIYVTVRHMTGIYTCLYLNSSFNISTGSRCQWIMMKWRCTIMIVCSGGGSLARENAGREAGRGARAGGGGGANRLAPSRARGLAGFFWPGPGRKNGSISVAFKAGLYRSNLNRELVNSGQNFKLSKSGTTALQKIMILLTRSRKSGTILVRRT
jgi:hypothetical protein